MKKRGAARPLDPPLYFGIAPKPFALKYRFETRARRVNRGDSCLPTRRGWDPAGCMTTEASGCSRLDGSNAQVQGCGEQPVAQYTSRARGGNQPLRKGEQRNTMGGSPEDSMLRADTE